MRSSIIIISALFISISCMSCAAALVGGAFYKVSKTREEKRKFMSEYNQTNLERQKLGLAPLDLCTEKYNFDEKWAKDDPPCKKRVEAYEAGDKTALGTSELEKINEQEAEQE